MILFVSDNGSGGREPRTVVFLAAYDSQLKWCAPLRDELARRGFDWQVVVPRRRSALSAGQQAAAGFDVVRFVDDIELRETALAADVVVSALAGPANEALLVDIGDRLGTAGRSGAPLGPVFVTGWVGVIIENHTAGYLNRCGSDIVAVNSRTELEHFLTVAQALQLPADNLLLTGLPILGGPPQPARNGPVRRVLFADQPTVPQRAEDRRYLYRQLLDYAGAHPDREVRLKPRHRPEEGTFHRMRYHPETLLAGLHRPANFAIDYTPIIEQLPETDLLLTVSSTASLEALHTGCQVGLVLDLGVHEKLGNHVFVGSGLLRTFAQLTADDIGRPDSDWMSNYLVDTGALPAEVLADRVEDLLASGRRPSRVVHCSPYFVSAAAHHRAIRTAGDSAVFGGANASWRRRVGRIGRAVLPPVLVKPMRRLATPASRSLGRLG